MVDGVQVRDLQRVGVVGTGVMATGIGVFITGFSSILTGLNFIVTVHRMRAPGLSWFRLPLFVWSQYATSLIMLLGTPVLAIAIVPLPSQLTVRPGAFTLNAATSIVVDEPLRGLGRRLAGIP